MSKPPPRRRSRPSRSLLKRKAFFIDERTLRRAKRAVGASTDAEAVRLCLERIAEMEDFWRFMKRSRGTVRPGSFEMP